MHLKARPWRFIATLRDLAVSRSPEPRRPAVMRRAAITEKAVPPKCIMVRVVKSIRQGVCVTFPAWLRHKPHGVRPGDRRRPVPIDSRTCSTLASCLSIGLNTIDGRVVGTL